MKQIKYFPLVDRANNCHKNNLCYVSLKPLTDPIAVYCPEILREVKVNAEYIKYS